MEKWYYFIFFNRAWKICSSYKLFDLEVKNLENIFLKNGYPVDFFLRIVSRFLHKKFEHVNVSEKNKIDYKTCIKIPYIGKPSLFLSRSLKNLFLSHFKISIVCVFTSFEIKNYFSLKCKTPFALSAYIVYKFTCLRDAEKFYIGKTSRHLAVRAKEHFDFKNSKIKSAINDHIFECDACTVSQLNVHRFQILKKCENDFLTKIHEAFLIKKLKPMLNKQLHNSGSSFLLNIFN